MPKILLLCLLLFSLGNPLLAAPEAELWSRWQAHDADSNARIDHRAWGATLRTYLYRGKDGINLFNYARVSESDNQRLERYLEQMAQIRISDYNRAVQRAYWINLYNALTVREILRHYPVDSIRDISSGFFSFGPWDKKLIEIEGEAVTLNDIEHRILRPIWQDARIHYALNCASIGCPDLHSKAFTAGNTEAILESAARDFINHPRGAQVIDGELQVSSVFIWFIDDFGGDEAGVIRHLKLYANPPLQAALGDIDHIDNDDYDWRLNSLTENSDAIRLRPRAGS